MEKQIDITLEKIKTDILFLFQSAKKVGWNEIRELSVMRTLYFCSLLFTFKHPQKKNPFKEYYEFALNLRGPYFSKINMALISLITNEFINQSQSKIESTYSLGTNPIPDNLSNIPESSDKFKWITLITNILVTYGEDKIYDFIFRDPEYNYQVKIQSQKLINISKDNKTIENLNEFKEAFEENFGDKVKAFDDKDYLEMYFNYIFSKILKGVS